MLMGLSMQRLGKNLRALAVLTMEVGYGTGVST